MAEASSAQRNSKKPDVERKKQRENCLTDEWKGMEGHMRGDASCFDTCLGRDGEKIIDDIKDNMFGLNR